MLDEVLRRFKLLSPESQKMFLDLIIEMTDRPPAQEYPKSAEPPEFEPAIAAATEPQAPD